MAFEEIKRELSRSVVVKAPTWDDPFYLSLTVTQTTFEFDLYQLKTSERKVPRPVYFANRLMKDAEGWYSLLEKHVACLVAGIKKFHHYLAGARQFKVLSDYILLKHVMSISEPTRRIGKWVMKLMCYSFEVFPKGVTFARMESGLACYKLRDVVVTPEIRKEDVEAQGTICAGALEQEL